MKIGILTFHHSRNYGAVLQAYGLQEVLLRMGHKVEVINYRNTAIEERKKPFTLRKFKSNPLRFFTLFLNVYFNYRRKVKNFRSFEGECLNVTKNEYLPNDILNSDYDCLVIGSDQVWSPVITNGPDAVFWGAYKPINAKMITYAASSSAISTLETEDFKQVGEWLERFDNISVREERLKVFVESHSNQKTQVVIDPTLLADRSIFERITSDNIIKEPYILLYSVESMPHLISIAKKVAKLYNAKIVRAGSNGLTAMIRDYRNNVTYKNASVQEMLGLVKHAECVVALSFHGTALSLLYEKEFFSVRGGNMGRVEALLSRCHLMNKIVDKPDQVKRETINYDEVNKAINEYRSCSLQWLRNALVGGI